MYVIRQIYEIMKYSIFVFPVICGALLLIWKFNFKWSSHKRDCNVATRIKGPLMGNEPILASYLKKHVLEPPSFLPYNLSETTTKNLFHVRYLNSHMFYKYVRRVLSREPPGFFVEAGAFDGQIASNTLWLESKRKWTGLLVEASPINCKNLKQKQRKAWISCSCITPKPFATASIFEFPTQMNYQSDVALYRSNVRSLESRFHTLDDMIQKTSHFTYDTINCFPLISFLNALDVDTVDLLSLDMQGGERGVVLSLPYERIKVRVMFIEHYKSGPNPSEPDREFIHEMKKRNYKLLAISEKTGEYIFVLNGDYNLIKFDEGINTPLDDL